MAEIQAQPTVADINGDGEVEIVVADVHGNVAAFNWRGKEVWERHLKSLVSQARLSSQHTLLNSETRVIEPRAGSCACCWFVTVVLRPFKEPASINYSCHRSLPLAVSFLQPRP